METGEEDYHIDARLERLFHAEAPRFSMENGDGEDIMANSLPEWLIGVIVIIILLVIAFFVMVISTIIKNKRKNRTQSSCDFNSTTHICDDLELGKISMIDPRTSTASFHSEEKDPVTNKCNPSSMNDEAISQPCCSTKSKEVDSPMCAYKNPLFVDDDSDNEPEHDGGCDPEPDGYKLKKMDSLDLDSSKGICCKSKGNKSKKSKGVTSKQQQHKACCNNLNSVEENFEDEKESAEESRTVKQKRGTEEPHSYCSNLIQSESREDVFQQTLDCDSEEVLVHRQGEMKSSSLPNNRASGCDDTTVNNESYDHDHDIQSNHIESGDCAKTGNGNIVECYREEDEACTRGINTILTLQKFRGIMRRKSSTKLKNRTKVNDFHLSG